jgi:hypothetical protein
MINLHEFDPKLLVNYISQFLLQVAKVVFVHQIRFACFQCLCSFCCFDFFVPKVEYFLAILHLVFVQHY